MKFLVIRLGAIGDVIHSSIIAQAIKTKYPDSEIHYLTADYIKPLLGFCPFIDKVIPFKMTNSNNFFYILKFCFLFLFKRYDVIFPLSNTFRNLLMAYFALPKKVVKRNTNRVHAVDAFYNTAVDAAGQMEKPEKLELKINENIKSKINEKIKDFPRPYIIFSPGGENDNARQGRIWSQENWIELGNKLADEFEGTIFITGSKAEAQEHQIYKKIKNSVMYSGNLSLEESAALYSVSDLFVSGDSGPLHIAACFDINIIGLFGSTNPKSVAPYGHDDSCIVPPSDCKFCGRKICSKLKQGEKITPCMKSITPDIVLDFILKTNKLQKKEQVQF